MFISNADATFTAFIELLSLWRVVNMSVRIFQLMCVSSAVRAKQQAKMAEYCRTIFGDALLIDPLEKYPVRLTCSQIGLCIITPDLFMCNSHQGLCSVWNRRPVSVLLLQKTCMVLVLVLLKPGVLAPDWVIVYICQHQLKPATVSLCVQFKCTTVLIPGCSNMREKPQRDQLHDRSHDADL